MESVAAGTSCMPNYRGQCQRRRGRGAYGEQLIVDGCERAQIVVARIFGAQALSTDPARRGGDGEGERRNALRSALG
jgi:hypothetical protein